MGERMRIKGNYGKHKPNFVEILGNPDGEYIRVKYIECSPANIHRLGTVRRIYRRCLIQIGDGK